MVSFLYKKRNMPFCHVCCDFKENGISCPQCNQDACLPCYERWVLSRPEHDATCVYCRQPLPMDLLYGVFGREEKFKEWRGHFLLEREKQLFVQDIPAVSEEMERKRQLQYLKGLYKKKKSVTRGKAKNLKKVDPTLLQEIEDLRKTLSISPLNPRKSKTSALMPCGSPRCRGFVMLPSHECGLCRTRVCKDCFVPLSSHQHHVESQGESHVESHVESQGESESKEEHECKEEDRATARLLMRDTKACPRCAVRIHKVSGCDQMWCVHCHCTFSWETLQVQSVSDPVHNPHYFEWLFEQRNHNINHHPPEGVNIPWHDLLRAIQQSPRFTTESEEQDKYYRFLFRVVRTLHHLRHVVVTQHYTTPRQEQHEENRALRHAFLKGECTQADMERLLWKREKKLLKKQACRTMWLEMCDAMENRLWQYVISGDGWDAFGDVVEELRGLIERVETGMESIIQKYGGTVHGRSHLEEFVFV